jgi:hypothetical protein
MPFIRNWPIIRKQTCWAAWDFSDGWWSSSHAIHSIDVIFKVDCNWKLKGVLPILPNHLRISFKIVKTTKEHEYGDKCTQINNKRRPQKRENMRCSSPGCRNNTHEELQKHIWPGAHKWNCIDLVQWVSTTTSRIVLQFSSCPISALHCTWEEGTNSVA